MSDQSAESTETSWLDVLYAPEEKYANPRDHLGRTATEFKSGCKKGDECLCPECRHPLVVKAGEKVSVHFSHAKGRANTACKGAFETPWHFAAKIAASNRQGWQREWSDGEWRYDACNTETGHVFEAVHSLSSTYIAKQRHIASTGRQSAWLFDSSAHFCQQSAGIRLDIKKAFVGILRVRDILKPKACDLIEEIGPDRCFLHYLGLAWKCIGRDEWAACDRGHEMSGIVYGSAGLNNMLVNMRASGDYEGTKVWFRDGAGLVSTAWSEITAENLVLSVREKFDTLYQEWLADNAKRSRLRLRKNSRQSRPSSVEDVYYRPTPVCGMPANGLTDAQIATAEQVAKSLVSSHRDATAAAVGNESNDIQCFPHVPSLSGIDHRGWCDYHCEKCGKWLGYSPVPYCERQLMCRGAIQ